MQRWRTQGSLRYLACELGVSTKQVTRYWDSGWISGGYRTPKGHRRIPYCKDTVERVRLAVRLVKDTNIEIRYRLPAVEYCGTMISAVGCNSMRDLYREARKPKYGLSKRDAQRVAYRHRGNPGPTTESISWEMLRMQTDVSQAEIDDQDRTLAWLPLESLLEAKSTKEFRAKARRAWRAILSEFRAEEQGRSHSTSLQVMRRKKSLEVLRKLLSEPDLRSFVSAFQLATESDHRIMSLAKKTPRAEISAPSAHDCQTASPLELLMMKEENELDTDSETRPVGYFAIKDFAERNPNAARLYVASRQLKHQRQRPSATALARVLGLSRPGLYRMLGTKKIQQILRPLRNDALAILEKRNWMEAKGKKRSRNLDDAA